MSYLDLNTTFLVAFSRICHDLYVWAYERSSKRYTAVQQSMGEPNRLKLQYRTTIHEIVRTLIQEKIRGAEVVQAIRDLIEKTDIPEEKRAALFSLIEAEILSLHEGNAVRFKVRPSEFQAWKELQG